MLGVQCSARQRADLVESAGPRRTQGSGAARPGHRHVVGGRIGEHLRGGLDGAADVAGVHREGGAERVQRDAWGRAGHPAAGGGQEGGGAFRLAQCEELVGGPRQCPSHQLGLTETGRVDRRQHSVGVAPTALPGQRVRQGQAGRQSVRPLQGVASQSLSQLQIAEPQCLLSGVHHVFGGLRRVAVGGQRRQPQLLADVRAGTGRQRADDFGAPGARTLDPQLAAGSLGEQRVSGVDHRIRFAATACAGFHSAQLLGPADGIGAGEADQVDQRQRLEDGQVVQHRARVGR